MKKIALFIILFLLFLPVNVFGEECEYKVGIIYHDEEILELTFSRNLHSDKLYISSPDEDSITVTIDGFKYYITHDSSLDTYAVGEACDKPLYMALTPNYSIFYIHFSNKDLTQSGFHKIEVGKDNEYEIKFAEKSPSENQSPGTSTPVNPYVPTIKNVETIESISAFDGDYSFKAGINSDNGQVMFTNNGKSLDGKIKAKIISNVSGYDVNIKPNFEDDDNCFQSFNSIIYDKKICFEYNESETENNVVEFKFKICECTPKCGNYNLYQKAGNEIFKRTHFQNLSQYNGYEFSKDNSTLYVKSGSAKYEVEDYANTCPKVIQEVRYLDGSNAVRSKFKINNTELTQLSDGYYLISETINISELIPGTPGNPNEKYEGVEDCGDLDVNRIKVCGCIPAGVADITSRIYFILRIVGPLLLLILGGFEMAKAISTQDESAISKAKKKLVNKFIAAAAIFLTLTVIKFIVGIVADNSKALFECIEILLNGYVI